MVSRCRINDGNRRDLRRIHNDDGQRDRHARQLVRNTIVEALVTRTRIAATHGVGDDPRATPAPAPGCESKRRCATKFKEKVCSRLGAPEAQMRPHERDQATYAQGAGAAVRRTTGRSLGA